MKTSQGKLAALAFLLLLAALLFAPMRAGEEDSLLLEPETLRMSVGDSYRVRCALSSENTDQRLTFASSDERVATIDPDGTVRALTSGDAVIRARASGGARAQMRVEVVGVPLRELELNVEEVHIDKGEFSGLSATYNDDASDTRLRWVSSNEAVVRVDGSGRLEGMGGGEAYVSAISPSGMSATARVYVKVRGTAVHISPNQLTLGVGARVPLKISYLPLDCTDSVRRIASSDPNVITIDVDGALRAQGQGSAYVTVLTHDGLTTGMEVQVEAAPREMQLDPYRATLERGDELQMQLMFFEADGSVDVNSKHLMVWSSSDPSVAAVDANGLVTARKSGTCQIEVESDGMRASCRLRVQVSVQEVQLDQSEVYLLREDAREPIQLHYSITPEDPDEPVIAFTSDNEQVATVTQDGLVQPTGGYGTAVIRATAASGAQAEFVVNVVTELPEAEPEATEPSTPEPSATPENAAPYEEMYQEIYDERAPEGTPVPAPITSPTPVPADYVPPNNEGSIWE